MADNKPTSRSPWLWVPSLYFAQGIPYVIVMTMSVVMYKRLGISNTDIALYTSWLYLPWVIKPLWSPLVDITRTKRLWVVLMQFLVSFGLALVAFSVRGSDFFRWSLFLFWIMAFASATHDIAADGFYMLSLSKHEQAWWVGLRSTFYRTAMIVGSGLLVVLAGVLEGKNGLPPVEIKVQTAQVMGAIDVNPPPTTEILMSSTNQFGFYGVTDPSQIKVTAEPGALRVINKPSALFISLAERGDYAKTMSQRAKLWNIMHGFEGNDKPMPRLADNKNGSWWTKNFSGPLRNFLAAHFPKPENAETSATAGNAGVIYFALSQPPPAGRTIAINFSRKPSGIEYLGFGKSDKGFQLMEGEHFTFNATNWNQTAMAVIQIDPNLRQKAEVIFLASSGNIPLAWSITLLVVAALFLAFSCWHGVMLPRPPGDGPVVTHKSLTGEFFATLGAFFQKPGILLAMAFTLFYRFDEAQLSKVISPFLLDSREAGGLGLATSQVGLVYGTFGVFALTCGGLLGGFLAAKHGLKKMLPFMVGSMYLPKLVFIFLAFTQPDDFLVTCGAVAVEQFGYGFGFTAFMLYLLYFADGPHKTAHYAICTGFMALGMMIPGMWSGWLADIVGYKHFFVWVICSTIPGLVLALRLKIDPQFGKKNRAALKN
jgi:PAT family beta-lactamase induction signal transducer AmpG